MQTKYTKSIKYSAIQKYLFGIDFLRSASIWKLGKCTTAGQQMCFHHFYYYYGIIMSFE